jgi:DNA repair exonuclease SbcCD ATPase subunit
MYKSELEELKERIDQISEFDNVLWDELRGFWDKVQGQVNDKNLFREHGASLREKTNGLFDKLKTLKKSLDKQFDEQSKKYMTSFKEELTEIENKIDQGLGLSPLFEELKKVQSKLRDFRFTKNDRNELWSNIDIAFKKLKEKRGATSHGGGNVNSLSRVENRYEGLIGAISKMQKSIDFDQRELDFQIKKVEGSEGQLEAQLRQAKIRMIEERVNSKKEKLDDMLKTKTDLEHKIEKEKKRAEKVEKQEKLEDAKEVVKLKIASEISEQSKEMDKISDKLEKAASELAKKPKAKKESIMENISESLEHLVEDVVDSAKAIAVVVGDKLEVVVDAAEDVIEDMTEKIEKKIDDFKNEDKEDNEDKEEE